MGLVRLFAREQAGDVPDLERHPAMLALRDEQPRLPARGGAAAEAERQAPSAPYSHTSHSHQPISGKPRRLLNCVG